MAQLLHVSQSCHFSEFAFVSSMINECDHVSPVDTVMGVAGGSVTGKAP
jgi:hypothetical protein